MKNLIIVTTICLFIPFNIIAQILTDLPCYTVNNNNGNGPTNLFVYNPSDHSWSNLGEIGPMVDGVKAIAIDPNTDVIYMYASGSGQFGIVDPNSANPTSFVPHSSCNGPGVGTANGDYGPVDLDDVNGLTFDAKNNILYGTHHINSGDLCDIVPNSNDVLFQIDPSTGCYIPGAMLDANGNPADYAIIQEASDATIGYYCGNEGLYDVGDIAYNPFTGDLIATQNQAGGPGVISIIDPVSGYLDAIVFDIDEDNIEGLGFSMFGELYASVDDDGPNGPQNSILYIDLAFISTTVLEFPDPTGTIVDFEAIDCSQIRNDLALNIALDPSAASPVQPGDDVTFNITVNNQGNFENSDILIVDYIPAGLILNDPNWASIPGANIAENIIPGPLAPGESIEVSITFTIDPTFTGGTINNYAEISASFNQGVISYYGDLIPLPDNDSTPDQTNNNDEEDEDDHDVATIAFNDDDNNDCPILIITKDTPFQNLYQSNGKIITRGNLIVNADQKVEYKASLVELNSGFEVLKGAEFDVKMINSIIRCN